MKSEICSICESEFEGFGNNPAPFPSDNDERCCDDCNSRFVVPVRMINMGNEKPTDSKGAMMVLLTHIARLGEGDCGPLFHLLTRIADIGEGLVETNKKFRALQKEGKIPGPA